MSTPPIIRVTINTDGAAYELAPCPDDPKLVGLRLYDVTGDDALVFFTRPHLERFYRDVGDQLARQIDATPHTRVTCRVLERAIGRNFELLRDAEKSEPAEVMRVVEAMLAHLRSWKPQTFAVVTPSAEVRRG